MKTLLIILASVVGFCKAQIVPSLLKDINIGQNSSNAIGALKGIELGSKFIFSANDGVNGQELWITDGSTANTVLLKDVNAGPVNSNPDNFFNFNNKTYFVATTATEGSELWVTDGTAAGTTIVKDINVGVANAGFTKIFQTSNIFYFLANNNTNGFELWKSDGTTAGTVMVKDINPGFGNCNIANWTDSGLGYYYFTATDGTNGGELWRSDGTSANTYMIKDIFSGTASSSASFHTMLNGKLILTADDGINGAELWKSDGTAAGTTLFNNYNGTAAASPNVTFISTIGTFGFFLQDNKIFKTDATTGSIQSYSISLGVGEYVFSRFVELNNDLCFFKKQTFFSSSFDTLTLVNFSTSTNNFSNLKKFGVMANSVVPQLYLQKNLNKFIFINGTNSPSEKRFIGITDGTTLGTIIPTFTGPAKPVGLHTTNYPILFFNNLWYIVLSDGLYKIDYSSGIANLVSSNYTSYCGPMNNFVSNQLFIYNNKIYFPGFQSGNGTELWETDGTTLNTFMLTDINNGASPSIMLSPTHCLLKNNFVTSNNVFFMANDGVHGDEIWRFNNTPAGINKKSISNNTSIVPNPFTNELKITATTLISKIEVVDVAGKIIYKGIFNSKEINFETKEFLKGIYIIKIESQDGSVEYKKIVKE